LLCLPWDLPWAGLRADQPLLLLLCLPWESLWLGCYSPKTEARAGSNCSQH
jgi:hypothetical protein